MSGDGTLEVVFADTCVLVNFVQREWEPDHSAHLIESETVDVVVSRNVVDELEDVADRRHDIYQDMIDFLLEEEGRIEDYDPGDRRIYLGDNDAGHVRNLQMELSSLDDRREVLRRLRRFVRAAGRRVEYLESSLMDTTVDPLPPFELKLAIDRVLNQSADAKVVADAAAWTADGGSGVLVTLDDDDLFDHENAIVELLVDEQGPEWAIEIISPDDVGHETKLSEEAD